MLAFKNNIYNCSSPGKLIPPPDSDYDSCFDPRHFIEVALNQEDDVLSFIERQPQEYWREDFLQFYPHAGKINSLYALKEILKILKSGLRDMTCWHQMTPYHSCFLYDVIVRFSFNYNHDSEKLVQLPELKGKPVAVFDSDSNTWGKPFGGVPCLVQPPENLDSVENIIPVPFRLHDEIAKYIEGRKVENLRVHPLY